MRPNSRDLSFPDAIFLDRDGVLNRERKDYVKCVAELELLPGALIALRRLAALDVPIYLITNQSAIGRRIVSRQEVDAIHQSLMRQVEAAGGKISQVYLCPHHPKEGCRCRKPAPGLLHAAAAENDLNLRRCVLIGDALTDALAADAAGCRSILVRSGCTGRELPGLVDAASEQGALRIESVISIVADIVEATELLTLVCHKEYRVSTGYGASIRSSLHGHKDPLLEK